MTRLTRRMSLMFLSGSPSTSTRSASLPGSTLPRRSAARKKRAFRSVPATIASIGVEPDQPQLEFALIRPSAFGVRHVGMGTDDDCAPARNARPTKPLHLLKGVHVHIGRVLVTRLRSKQPGLVRHGAVVDDQVEDALARAESRSMAFQT